VVVDTGQGEQTQNPSTNDTGILALSIFFHQERLSFLTVAGARTWSGDRTEQLETECMFRDLSEGETARLATVITRVQFITTAIIAILLAIVVVLSTVHLGYLIGEEIWRHPRFLIPVQGLLEIFGYFLLVLIGVELLETLKVYLKRDIIHIRVVIEVALIAMARKVITEELESVSSLTLFAIAALILALAIALYFERQGRETRGV
jgi:uncharacterized membrane protein (DUF373 family)